MKCLAMPLIAGIALLSGCAASRVTTEHTLQVRQVSVSKNARLTATLYGGAGEDYLRALHCGSNDCSLFGRTDKSFTSEEDYLVIRTTAAGQPIWARAYGGTSRDTLRNAIPTRDGGALLVGASSSLFYTSLKVFSPHKAPRPLLIRIDHGGKIKWAETAEMSGPTWRLRLETGIQTGDGGFLLAGYYQDWTTKANSSLQGPHFISRIPAPPENAATDAILIRLDPTGKLEWLKRYQVHDEKFAHYSKAWHVLSRPDGRFLAVLFDGSDDRVVTVTINGASGDPIEAHTLEGMGDSIVKGALRTAGNGYVLLGDTFNDKTVLNTWLAQYNAQGTLVDIQSYPRRGFTPIKLGRLGADNGYCIVGRSGHGMQSRAEALAVIPPTHFSKILTPQSDAATELFAAATRAGHCLAGGSTMSFGADGTDLMTINWSPRSQGQAGPSGEKSPGAHMEVTRVTSDSLKEGDKDVIDPLPTGNVRVTTIPVSNSVPTGNSHPPQRPE